MRNRPDVNLSSLNNTSGTVPGSVWLTESSCVSSVDRCGNIIEKNVETYDYKVSLTAKGTSLFQENIPINLMSKYINKWKITRRGLTF